MTTFYLNVGKSSFYTRGIIHLHCHSTFCCLLSGGLLLHMQDEGGREENGGRRSYWDERSASSKPLCFGLHALPHLLPL